MSKKTVKSVKAIKFPKTKKAKSYPTYPSPERFPKLHPGAAESFPRFDFGGGVSDKQYMGDEFAAAGKGALSGAATGATIGNAVPVIGTAIGAVGGAIVGGAASFFGQRGADKQKAMAQQQQNQPQQPHYQTPLAPPQYPYFADGGPLNTPAVQSAIPQSGEPRKKIINVEHNELEINPKTFEIVRDFKNKPPHPENENLIDERGNTKATEGNFIIPKKFRDKYEDGDMITRRSLVMKIHRDNTKRSEQEAMVANDNLQKMLKKGGFYKNGGPIDLHLPKLQNKNSNFYHEHNYDASGPYDEYGKLLPLKGGLSLNPGIDTWQTGSKMNATPYLGLNFIKTFANGGPVNPISSNGLPFGFGGEVGVYANGGSTDKDGDTVKMEKGEFAKEHKNLLKVLRTGTKAQREKEAVKQQTEMAEKMKHGGPVKHFLNKPVPQQFMCPDVKMGNGGGIERYDDKGLVTPFDWGNNVGMHQTQYGSLPQEQNTSIPSLQFSGLPTYAQNPAQNSTLTPPTSPFPSAGYNINIPGSKYVNDYADSAKPFGYTNAAQKTAEWSPTAFNLVQGITQKPFQYDQNKYQLNHNIPYRDVNFRPIAQGIESQGMISRQNARDASGGNGGNFMSNANQIGANRQGQYANALMTAQEYNNQNRFSVDRANLSTEEHNKGLALQIDQMNRMNKAKSTEYIGKGLEGASGLAQRDMYQGSQSQNQQQLLGGMAALYPWLSRYFQTAGVPGQPAGKLNFPNTITK